MSDQQSVLERLQAALDESQKLSDQTMKEYSIYWGKKDIKVAAAILNEFAKHEDVVLDPFVGSGSTLYGAIASRIQLKFIGVDVNELPISQIYFNLQCVNPENVRLGGESLKNLVNDFKLHYQYSLEGEIYEISKTLLDLDGPKMHPTKFWIRSTQDNRVFTVEPGSALFSNLRDQYLQRQEDRKFSTDLELPRNSRIAIKAGMKISDLYSPINFKILIAIREYLNADLYLRGLLASVLHLAKFTDLGSQSQFPYWYPKNNAIDRNLLLLLEKKHKQISNAIGKLGGQIKDIKNFDSKMYLLQTEPIQNYVAPKSFGLADIIITDPPYFDQVAYSEYLLVWEFFTGLKADLEHEIVESNRAGGGKTREAYLHGMGEAFHAIRSGAKSSALMFMYYKDSKLSNINDILSVMAKSGWSFIGQCHVNKNQFSYKQNASKDSTVAGDCLMVFNASKPSFKIQELQISPLDASQKVIEIVDTYLREFGPSSISQIYDEVLVQRLYELGILGAFPNPKSLFSLLQSSFDYSRETRKISVQK